MESTIDMESNMDDALNAPYRNMEREREEGVNAFRGIFYGTLFSLPIWGLIIWGVVAVVNAVNAN